MNVNAFHILKSDSLIEIDGEIWGIMEKSGWTISSSEVEFQNDVMLSDVEDYGVREAIEEKV